MIIAIYRPHKIEEFSKCRPKFFHDHRQARNAAAVDRPVGVRWVSVGIVTVGGQHSVEKKDKNPPKQSLDGGTPPSDEGDQSPGHPADGESTSTHWRKSSERRPVCITKLQEVLLALES